MLEGLNALMGPSANKYTDLYIHKSVFKFESILCFLPQT